VNTRHQKRSAAALKDEVFMKNKIAASIIFSAICCTGFTSCGTGIPEPIPETVDYVYDSDTITLAAAENISPHAVYYTSADTSFPYTVVAFENSESVIKPAVIRIRENGEQEMQVLSLPDNTYASYVYTVTEDGSFYYVTVGEKTSVMKYTDQENTVLIPDAALLFGEDTVTLQHIAVDADGICYLLTDKQLAAADPAGNPVMCMDYTNRISDLYNGMDGNVYIQYSDAGTGNERIDKIDSAQQKITGVPTPYAQNLMNVQYFMESEQSYYLDNGEFLQYCTVQEDGTVQTEPLCSWINSDIVHSCIRDFGVNRSGQCILLYNTPADTGEMQVLLLHRQEESNRIQRYIITAAGQDIPDSIIRRTVEFNRTNDRYRVVWKDYGNYNTTDDPEAGERALQLDMARGEVPDIFLLSAFQQKRAYTAQNLFVDFYDLFREDTAFDESMLLPCVLQPFSQNGELYELTSRFTLHTMVIQGGESEWDTDTFIKQMEGCTAEESIFANTTPVSTLRSILTASLTAFADSEKAKCSFDSESFRNILQFAKETGNVNFWITETGTKYKSAKNAAYRDGYIKVLETDISSLYDYVSLCAKYHFEDMYVIGYPCASGNGIIVNPTVSWSIYNLSPVQDGAWQYIKEMLHVTAKKSREPNYDMAALRETFILENSGQWGVGTSYVFTDSGARILENTEAYTHDPSNGILHTITEDDLTAFTALLERTSAAPAFYPDIMNIVMEEASGYFGDNKTLEETVHIIQNRCAVYMSENYG